MAVFELKSSFVEALEDLIGIVGILVDNRVVISYRRSVAATAELPAFAKEERNDAHVGENALERERRKENFWCYATTVKNRLCGGCGVA